MQGFIELINYQRTVLIEPENTRVWLTNVIVGRYFNEFITDEMKIYILKRVIVNGSTGSSSLFKHFNKLQVIVTDKTSVKNVSSG